MNETGLQLVSTLHADGRLVVELAPQTQPEPAAHEVVVRVEAAPINPSDLGGMFGPALLDTAHFSLRRIEAMMPEAATRALAARHGLALRPGNEGAGTVIAAGSAPEAQALLGKRVTGFPGGGIFATWAVIPVHACMVLPDDVTSAAGASAFVNPLTALSFVEAMRREGHTALIHTAAASNLGQMLVRICAEDGVPLVNIVRSADQVALLKGLGAEHVLDSTSPGFREDLIAAIAATGATCAFDAIGGGTLGATLLWAMEQVAQRNSAFNRYGSESPKRLWIYGALDLSPTIINRNFGFVWDVSAFLLMPFLNKIGPERAAALRARVLSSLKTTFASHYAAQVPLGQLLERDKVLAYNARRTGEKYLIVAQ